MSCALVWFRRDLRLADNPALDAARRRHQRVVAVYLHAPSEAAPWAPGAASRWWLHHSLAALDRSLRQRGSRLVLRLGPALEALSALIRETGARAVYWNHATEPARRARDARVAAALAELGITVHQYNGALLFEPDALRKGDGDPYRVFTPFWRAALRAGLPTTLAPAPRALPPVPRRVASRALDEFALLPRIPWDTGLAAVWVPGEDAGRRHLRAFVRAALAGYPATRDRPDRDGTSRLSPHLHFGELSPRQVTAAVQRAVARQPGVAGAGDAFLRQLGWREFARHLLHHFPHTPERPLDTRFESFPWRARHATDLAAWQAGRTGIPLVDAGMRALWAEGWLHNRVRMAVASMLTKNLLIPWQAGAQWFWDTLVDADLANNTLGWQWTAGCGADAAPYFRVFNPVRQGERFDPGGDYVRRWLPELAAVPARWVHRPWAAPAGVLARAGVRLGRDYPRPIVDLAASRERALAAWARLKGRRNRP